MNVLILTYKRPYLLDNLFDLIPVNANIYIGTDVGFNHSFKRKQLSRIKVIRFPSKHEGQYYGYVNNMNWFFNQVEEGIILEEDILPTNEFFTFCETSLQWYRDDKKIFHISGFNPVGEIPHSYYSRIPLVWGYATWRDRWQLYDDKVELEYYPKDISFYILNKITDTKARFNTVDVNWAFTMWKHNAYALQSPKCLTKHIGYDSNSRHSTYDYFKKLKTSNDLTYRYDDLLFRKIHPSIFGKIKVLIQNKSLIKHIIGKVH